MRQVLRIRVSLVHSSRQGYFKNCIEALKPVTHFKIGALKEVYNLLEKSMCFEGMCSMTASEKNPTEHNWQSVLESIRVLLPKRVQWKDLCQCLEIIVWKAWLKQQLKYKTTLGIHAYGFLLMQRQMCQDGTMLI